ncbi:hypothetical protein PUNSTDRAFT_133889 [Punctularia strigosozonata HHB-11173 SS5]|uniref:uncharacterized protein n=1 Tax=Punctularia strigosozonata (strain HHB-11173) TaxID=741275 RepID=UPI0004418548|nr:uncharacterized protein PUNSTDRAFT_133889 [Punctularia strigosozonata HHB-11173 SS5]EIN08704.1 hypothetical protein PUNSTDRAFT_133889 [Punctularia strigosozonata HHB-11173 SS5]
MADNKDTPDNHRLGEPYSAANPIPKVVTSVKGLIDPQRATEAKAQQVQASQQQSEQKDTAKRAGKMAKGKAMRVTDPTTGEEVDLRNSQDEEPDTRNKGENVLKTDYPPPDWKQYGQHAYNTTANTAVAIGLSYITSALLFQALPLPVVSQHRFLNTLLSLIPPSIVAYTLLFRLQKSVRFDFDARVWHAERMRGLKAGSDVDGDGNVSDEERTKESAEWLNALLRGVWPIMNTDIFAGAVDMLEDIMQASVPSFIDMVRIRDIGLGSNALRVTSIRSLPDAKHDVATMDSLGDEEREQLDGDHINIEIGFAYKALPSGTTASSKAHNAHLLIEFFMGVKGLWAVPVPIWVELTGAVGTVRARIQLIPDPPFIKTTMVTLMGLPKIDIAVVALSKALPNVMNLPFVSGFISSAMNTAAAEYVAPKSLTLDLQQLLSGDDIKKDTETIGVLVVHIHRAMNIKKTDAISSAGKYPYVTLTYSRLGKPLYSTRIIKKDRNPVYEETAVLLVDANMIKLREQLSIQLWDSDRMSVDDMMGIVNVDILELMREKGKPFRRISHLDSPDSEHRRGSIEYTVGYYGKTWPNATLKTDGSDPAIPLEFKQSNDFKEARATALNDLEAAVLVTPPDPAWPSGILSVQVHEIRDLAIKTSGREKKAKQEGEKGQDEQNETNEEGEGLPSSYCTISLNDEIVYETRVKPITSTPTFNAGTERFVRDWRQAHVTVAVKDARRRENDTILGVLSDLLINASELTRAYSIERGLGTGRIRISLLFRPVAAKLPPNLLGFDSGLLEVRDISLHSDDEHLRKCELQLRSTKSSETEKISRKKAETTQDGRTVWHIEEEASLPIKERYGAVLAVHFKHVNPLHKSLQGLAVLWLRDLVDNTETKIDLPVWRTNDDDDYDLLMGNYSPPDGDLSMWDDDKSKLQRVGTLTFDCTFVPGMSSSTHKKMLLQSGVAKKKGMFDQLEREETAGLRGHVGDTRYTQSKEGGTPGEHKHTEFLPPAKPEQEGTAAERPLGDAEEVSYRLGEGNVHTNGQSNTEVGPDAVDNEVTPEQEAEDGGGDETGGRESANEDEDHKKHKGLIGKFKEWKEHEKELHRDHRGVMQAKPARTMEWLKDNMEEGAHSLKGRFTMKERKPNIDTEA